MFADVAAGDLIGDALITEGVQKPVENLGCISMGDGIEDIGFLHINADVIKKSQRASQTADPSDQINRANKMLGDLIGGSTGLTSFGRSNRFVGRSRF